MSLGFGKTKGKTLVKLPIRGLLAIYKINTFDSHGTNTKILILCAREAFTNPKPLGLIVCKSILFRRTQQQPRLRVVLREVLSGNVGGISPCFKVEQSERWWWSERNCSEMDSMMDDSNSVRYFLIKSESLLSLLFLTDCERRKTRV